MTSASVGWRGRRGAAFLAPGDDVPAHPKGTPALSLQVNALQALCRQVFGFRLAMIALAGPLAVDRAQPGLPTWFVGGAVTVTFMVSYMLFRDWERFGPLLLRHPLILAGDMLFTALLLVTASTESVLAYVSVCTPLLAGLAYGWRGSALFAVLQSLILGLLSAVEDKGATALSEQLLLPGFCVIVGAVGVTLRNMMLRFGTASQALTETRARLAVQEAVGEERERLAREMHDSVAKTLHGVALAAEGLAASADRSDREAVKSQAALVSRAARRAAAESRELLSDLRRESGQGSTVTLGDELGARVVDFGRRSGLEATFRQTGDIPSPVPGAVARQLLTIASEAMENAHRHARATRVQVTAGVAGSLLRLSVIDNGAGLPPRTSLEELKQAGHFGLVGMVERAMGIGARIRIGTGRAVHGTEVRVELPLAALAPRGQPSVTDPAEPPATG